jgi:hypothetical protein
MYLCSLNSMVEYYQEDRTCDSRAVWLFPRNTEFCADWPTQGDNRSSTAASQVSQVVVSLNPALLNFIFWSETTMECMTWMYENLTLIHRTYFYAVIYKRFVSSPILTDLGKWTWLLASATAYSRVISGVRAIANGRGRSAEKCGDTQTLCTDINNNFN